MTSAARITNQLRRSTARVNGVLWAIGFLLLATVAHGQEPPVEIPPVDRKPYSANGFLEFRPVMIWQDTDAALFRLRSFTDETPDARTMQLNSRVQLDASYRRGWFSAQTRSVVDTGYTSGDWTADATAYEAYLSLKPAPSFTVDAGKKTLKWGKGYIWNPAAFLDRVKSPEDPALALEGFTVVSADYIRTFSGPLQVMSVTPVLLPVFGDLNQSFGERGHLNVAGRLYLLLLDTDIDVMFLTGGSRGAARFGFDFSRNLRSNLEIHGEVSRVPNGLTAILESAGTLAQREQPATSIVMGVRYLTEANTTIIADYYRNGAGYAPAEMETYFEHIEHGFESWTVSGDQRALSLASRATEAGYGRMNPMRNYLYGRVNQPDAFDILYLTLGASAIVNADDGSYSLLPEVQYKPIENLELRWVANIQRGGSRTEFGEKQADVRFELRARYYF
ncbi:MAG TPA: hypothetical protein VI485_08480 [Vicinamibacterales bacterium]|nr:hypothetical protein [Vicinamibacterales bacterium]